MVKIWIFAKLLLATAVTYCLAAVTEVEENSAVTIVCPLSGNIQYPTWTGPAGLASPLTQGQTINEAGFSWATNNKDLRLAKAMLKHDGMYTCRDSNQNTDTVELDVQYFSAMADITTNSAANTQVVFTCTSYSNPTSTIKPTAFSRSTSGQTDPAKTTFYPCETDPTMENRLKCRVVNTGYALKQDNGKENSCEFIYKNQTRLTLTRPINFQFPPTSVKISGYRAITDAKQNILKLTCAADSSNPVSTLVWRKGTQTTASENTVISSTYQTVIMTAEYNGRNITQDIDIVVTKAMDKEMVFCCAIHGTDQLCDSVTLKYDATSAAGIMTAWLTLIVVCVTFLASL